MAFGITLASKPHQEDVTDINKYVWQSCVNYIRLNMITRPAEYPIPRCDDAVMYGFRAAKFFILLDAYVMTLQNLPTHCDGCNAKCNIDYVLSTVRKGGWS